MKGSICVVSLILFSVANAFIPQRYGWIGRVTNPRRPREATGRGDYAVTNPRTTAEATGQGGYGGGRSGRDRPRQDNRARGGRPQGGGRRPQGGNRGHPMRGRPRGAGKVPQMMLLRLTANTGNQAQDLQ